jgi:hypothetical protein
MANRQTSAFGGKADISCDVLCLVGLLNLVRVSLRKHLGSNMAVVRLTHAENGLPMDLDMAKVCSMKRCGDITELDWLGATTINVKETQKRLKP